MTRATVAHVPNLCNSSMLLSISFLMSRGPSNSRRKRDYFISHSRLAIDLIRNDQIAGSRFNDVSKFQCLAAGRWLFQTTQGGVRKYGQSEAPSISTQPRTSRRKTASGGTPLDRAHGLAGQPSEGLNLFPQTEALIQKSTLPPRNILGGPDRVIRLIKLEASMRAPDKTLKRGGRCIYSRDRRSRSGKTVTT